MSTDKHLASKYILYSLLGGNSFLSEPNLCERPYKSDANSLGTLKYSPVHRGIEALFTRLLFTNQLYSGNNRVLFRCNNQFTNFTITDKFAQVKQTNTIYFVTFQVILTSYVLYTEWVCNTLITPRFPILI